MTNTDLKTINLTAELYRFLKSNGAYPYFKDALKTTENGRMFLDTLYALRFDPNGKKEDCANDPIKWIFLHNKKEDGKNFLSNFFNEHICWTESKPNSHFWENLHLKWKQYFYIKLFPSVNALPSITTYKEDLRKYLREGIKQENLNRSNYETEELERLIKLTTKTWIFSTFTSIIVTIFLCL